MILREREREREKKKKEKMSGKERGKKLWDEQNNGDSGYVGAASLHPYGSLPEDGWYKGRAEGLLAHVGL
jgi:hypothetical protein